MMPAETRSLYSRRAEPGASVCSLPPLVPVIAAMWPQSITQAVQRYEAHLTAWRTLETKQTTLGIGRTISLSKVGLVHNVVAVDMAPRLPVASLKLPQGRPRKGEFSKRWWAIVQVGGGDHHPPPPPLTSQATPPPPPPPTATSLHPLLPPPSPLLPPTTTTTSPPIEAYERKLAKRGVFEGRD